MNLTNIHPNNIILFYFLGWRDFLFLFFWVMGACQTHFFFEKEEVLYHFLLLVFWAAHVISSFSFTFS
jgi:hypothetical protein